MKKNDTKKLTLNRETITRLELAGVAGASLGDTSLGSCYCTGAHSVRYSNQMTQPLCA